MTRRRRPAARRDAAQIDRARLAKICGLFGSDQVGERAAAALRADKMVREFGLTWPIVLGVESGGADRRQQSRRTGMALTPAQILSHHGDTLTKWERGFLANIIRRNGPPTVRQTEIIEEIRARVCEVSA